jgi:hypothetical protein
LPSVYVTIACSRCCRHDGRCRALCGASGYERLPLRAHIRYHHRAAKYIIHTHIVQCRSACEGRESIAAGQPSASPGHGACQWSVHYCTWCTMVRIYIDITPIYICLFADLNPRSYEYLVQNARLNHVHSNDSLYCYNLDGREFIYDLARRNIGINHAILNLPGSATDFLDAFIGLKHRYSE